MKPFDPFKDFGVEVPHPKKFPVSFAEMLRCVMPQVETKAERQKRFFEYLQETPRAVRRDGKLVPAGKISFKDAWDELEKMKGENYGEGLYCMHAQGFLRWWVERLSKKRTEIGSSGGRPKKVLARRKRQRK
jgi:hypothetical protein